MSPLDLIPAPYRFAAQIAGIIALGLALMAGSVRLISYHEGIGYQQAAAICTADKLKAEAPGILQWMIEGCLEWERNGLKPPQVVKESTEEYLGAEDSLQQWIDECCDMGPYFATSKALFTSWSLWCDSSGEFVGTMKRLMAKLESRGIKTGQKERHRRG